MDGQKYEDLMGKMFAQAKNQEIYRLIIAARLQDPGIRSLNKALKDAKASEMLVRSPLPSAELSGTRLTRPVQHH